jgi:hypothetical protein
MSFLSKYLRIVKVLTILVISLTFYSCKQTSQNQESSSEDSKKSSSSTQKIDTSLDPIIPSDPDQKKATQLLEGKYIREDGNIAGSYVRCVLFSARPGQCQVYENYGVPKYGTGRCHAKPGSSSLTIYCVGEKNRPCLESSDENEIMTAFDRSDEYLSGLEIIKEGHSVDSFKTHYTIGDNLCASYFN